MDMIYKRCISLYFIGGYLFLLRSQKWQFGVLKSDVRDQIHVTNKWYRKRSPSYVCWFTEQNLNRDYQPWTINIHKSYLDCWFVGLISNQLTYWGGLFPCPIPWLYGGIGGTTLNGMKIGIEMGFNHGFNHGFPMISHYLTILIGTSLEIIGNIDTLLVP